MLLKSVLIFCFLSHQVFGFQKFDSGTTQQCESQSCMKRPNILLFLGDDVGYGDFQSFGHPTQEYGGVDRMVDEGMKFTQWYSAASVCTPSRMAMLTGRYPIRSGWFSGKNEFRVFLPSSPEGIPRGEITIAESLKSVGYVTGMVGKWHLGINKYNNTDGYHLPVHHGFDFVGTNLPFTNADNCNSNKFNLEEMSPLCLLYNGSTIIEQPINLTTLTSRLVSDSKHFISSNRQNNFFMYFSFPQTHTAMFCSPEFCGKSKRGSYGDNINEMSSAIKTLLNYLDELDLSQDTLVLFLSDHGGMYDLCPHGGDNGPFKGGKGTSWEGGFRVPAVIRWPGVIPARSVSSSVISSLDLYPTLLKLAQNSDEIEANSQLDGKIIKEILCNLPKFKGNTEYCSNKESKRILFYYCFGDLHAVRYGDIKVHYVTKQSPPSVKPKVCGRLVHEELAQLHGCRSHITYHDPPLMFNLTEDSGEKIPLDVAKHQSELDEINNLVLNHKDSIEKVDSLSLPPNPVLRPCCNPPSCMCSYN